MAIDTFVVGRRSLRACHDDCCARSARRSSPRPSSPGTLSAQTITATIDGTAKGAPISPLIYGMFVEHGGSLLEQGFRAELLDDRKFYFAIGQKAPTRPGPFRLAARGWQGSGAPSAVRMDSAHAYASDHAPLVTLAGAEPRGIAQDGIALKGGVGYTGRIVVAGDPGAHVAVSLVWGPGAADRQTIRLAPLTAAVGDAAPPVRRAVRRAPIRRASRSPAPDAARFASAPSR